MKQKFSVISSKYNVVWLVYTIHYVGLFAMLASERFSVQNAGVFTGALLPLNIAMNSISVVLAIVGIIVSHMASRNDTRYWNLSNLAIHIVMIAWVLGGSLWVLLLLVR